MEALGTPAVNQLTRIGKTENSSFGLGVLNAPNLMKGGKMLGNGDHKQQNW
jgi:hypothetical protein